jgi:hypothetical protein
MFESGTATVIGWHRAQVELGDPQFRVVHESLIAALQEEPLRIPSRFQLGDAVRVQGERGEVCGISFLLTPADPQQVAALDEALGNDEPTLPFEFAKIHYDVRTKSGIKYRVIGDDVTPGFSTVKGDSHAG